MEKLKDNSQDQSSLPAFNIDTISAAFVTQAIASNAISASGGFAVGRILNSIFSFSGPEGLRSLLLEWADTIAGNLSEEFRASLNEQINSQYIFEIE